MAEDAVRLIVGLGNPGPDYEGTRHNAGAQLVAALAARHGVALASDKRCKGLTGRLQLAGQDVRLLIPATYMNRSGDALAPCMHYFRIPAASVLVAHDEIDLPPGAARLKRGGGHGGNNGLRDIIRALGGERGFGRLRLGVGHPGHKDRVVGYVLSRAPASERGAFDDAVEAALEVLPLLAEGAWERAMTQLHSQRPEASPTSRQD